MLQRSPATSAAPASFGAMLRFLRRRARLTQAGLGIAVGYSDAQICRLETGRRLPDLTALAALFLPALGLDPHGDEAQRLLALAALAAAESQRPPPRALLRIPPAQLARPAEDYGQLFEACIALAEQADRGLDEGEDQAGWSDRLEAAHDRMRIALGWAQARGDLRGLRLATALWRLWYSQGHLREGRRWLEIFLALPGAAGDPYALARALDAAGLLAWRQSDYAQAEKWYGQALALVRELPGQPGAARLLMRMGILFSDQDSLGRAQGYYEESLALYQAAGDEQGATSVLHNLGNLACQQNDNERAMACFEACLAYYERVGDRSGEALILLGVGTIARDRGDPQGAGAAFSRSLELARAVGDDWNVAIALLNLADVAADRRMFANARRHLDEAQQLLDQIGDQQSLSTLAIKRGELELLDGRLAAAVGAYRHGLMLAAAIRFQIGVAESLEGLAACAGPRQPSLAARLFAAAHALRSALGVPVPLASRAHYEAQVARARRRARGEEWERDWASGLGLSAAEATALALANVTERFVG